MTNILAYDIDGRPLRAGDRAVFVGLQVDTEFNGVGIKVLGPDPTGEHELQISVPGSIALLQLTNGDRLRRIDSDHKPATESFTELMTNLKTGSLEPLEIE